jgi:hypothetical protein
MWAVGNAVITPAVVYIRRCVNDVCTQVNSHMNRKWSNEQKALLLQAVVEKSKKSQAA